MVKEPAGSAMKRIWEAVNGGIQQQDARLIHTPLLPAGSRTSPHAFILLGLVSTTTLKIRPRETREPYTKGSLTETTNTWPAAASLGCEMYPGIWLDEHAGPGRRGSATEQRHTAPEKATLLLYAAGTPMI